MSSITKGDLQLAAAMVAGVTRPFEGRIAHVLQELNAKDPDTVKQLFQAMAETYPVKAVRLSERAGIPIPASGMSARE